MIGGKPESRILGFGGKAPAAWAVFANGSLGHMLDTLSYYPEEVLRDPWVLVRLWEGLSSFGGFTGAIVAGVIWRYRHKVPILAYADVVVSAGGTMNREAVALGTPFVLGGGLKIVYDLLLYRDFRTRPEPAASERRS